MRYLVTGKYIYKVDDNGLIFLEDKEITGIEKDQLINNLTRGNVRFESLLYTQKELDDYKEVNFLARKQRREMREKSINEANLVLDNIQDYTPKEIYRAFEVVNKVDFGWSLSQKVFISENPLSNLLLDVIGGYTATPFDDGKVILKTKNGYRYSNKRGYKSIYELL